MRQSRWSDNTLLLTRATIDGVVHLTVHAQNDEVWSYKAPEGGATVKLLAGTARVNSEDWEPEKECTVEANGVASIRIPAGGQPALFHITYAAD